MRALTIGNRYPPWSAGGYEAIWAETVAALRSAGHQVRVLCTVPDPSDRLASSADPDVHRELRWYWREHRFPPVSLRQAVALERANAAVLASHLERFRPDAVIWWAMGGMSLSLIEQVRRARLPALGIVGDDWMGYGPSVDGWSRRWRGVRAAAGPLAERLTGLPARVDLERAARWLFISEHLLADARNAGRRLSGALVAHPGVDPQRFPPAPLGPWRWRFLYCGRIDPRKGIATAVQALAQVPEAELTIDGDGDRAHAEELAALAWRLGVGERVRLRCSPREALAEAYAEADAVLFPVRWREPWGLVPLEAMAVGRPVLASRSGGGPSEYLRDGVNCLQFEPGAAGALAAAMRRLADEPQLRARLIAAGAETARRLSARRFYEAIERELGSLLAARR